MDDDGELCRLCQFHLLSEDCLLYFSWGVIVEIVEADFSPGYYLGIPRPFEHLGVGGFGGQAGFVRMDSYAGVDSGIFGWPSYFSASLMPQSAVAGPSPFPMAR